MKTLSILTLAVIASSAHAAVVTEYFNDYGTTNVQLSGTPPLNGGSGWSGAWQGGGSSAFYNGSNLTYSGTGYSMTGNDSTGGNDGYGTGNGAGTISYRSASTDLTGTIWISATVYQTGAGDIFLWLDKTDTATSGSERDFVALRGSTGTTGGSTPEAVIGYNGTDDTSSEIDFANNTTHLFLVRVDMNYSGTLDSVNFWINPNLTGGIAGLSTPIYSKNGLDTFGDVFRGLGVSAGSTSSANRIDAIRMSDEADAFDFVITGVPEPSGALLAFSGLALAVRRRR